MSKIVKQITNLPSPVFIATINTAALVHLIQARSITISSLYVSLLREMMGSEMDFWTKIGQFDSCHDSLENVPKKTLITFCKTETESR